jgi:hypothetical protein
MKTKKWTTSIFLDHVDKTYGVLDSNSPNGKHITKTISNALKETVDSSLQFMDTNGITLKDFLLNYELVFHSNVRSVDTQHRHRVDYAAGLYEQYYSKQFHTKTIRETTPEINRLIEKKGLYARDKLRKYPVMVGIMAENSKTTDLNIEYFTSMFLDEDYTIDFDLFRKDYYTNIPMVILGFSSIMQLNLLQLSMPQGFKIDKHVDFTPFVESMDEVEHIIETKFLKQ